MSTPPRRALIIALFYIAAFCYSLWVIAPLVGSDLSPMTSFVSELYAEGQPYAHLFRAGDAIAGFALVTAMLLWEAPRRPNWWRIGRWSIVGFGISTIVDALCPLSCTPTADEACAARDRAFDVPWTHNVHNVSSTTAGIFLLAASIAIALALTRHDPLMPKTWITWVMAIGLVITSLWTVYEVLVYEYLDLPGTDTLGLAQRLQVFIAVLWLLYIPHHLRQDPQ